MSGDRITSANLTVAEGRPEALTGPLARLRDAALRRAEGELLGRGQLSVGQQEAVDRLLEDAARWQDRLDMIERRAAVTDIPRTYTADGPYSFFADLLRRRTNPAAAARLRAHYAEVREDRERLARAMRLAAREQLIATGSVPASLARAISTTTGAGGELIPPAWMLEEYASVGRPGTPFTSRCRRVNVPGQGFGSTVRIPRITAQPGAGPAPAQNTLVPAPDLTTDSQSAPYEPLVTSLVVSLQEVEQTPPGILDATILADLLADLDAKIENAALNGAGALTGLLGTTGVNAISYTTVSPTAAGVVDAIARAASAVGTNRKRVATMVLAHPRRISWLYGQADSNGQPVAALAGQQPPTSLDVEDGPFGPIAGLPAYASAWLPTTGGTSANQDTIAVVRPSDHLLVTTDPVVATDNETYAPQGSVLLSLRVYVAFTASRFPTATSLVAGTGLTAPAGY